jgi:hypothetical protein
MISCYYNRLSERLIHRDRVRIVLLLKELEDYIEMVCAVFSFRVLTELGFPSSGFFRT